MTEFKRLWKLCSAGAAAFALILAAGCGGSGGGGGGTEETGSVSVLMTDAPSRDFLEFRVTVSRIELIDERRRRVTIKSQESEFDLLRLENLSSLFAQTSDVPAGTYSKIRLTVSGIELIDRRTRNSIFPLTTREFKIDLKPRQPFEVSSNSRLVVEIDIDARRSVRWRRGRYRFRPVVRVKVGVEQVSHLVEVRGVVNSVDLIDESFEICRVDETEAGVTVSDECLTADLSADSSIFNPDGVEGGINDLVVTEIVKVVGNLGDDASVINVKVVERDALSAYVTLYGTVLSPSDLNSIVEVTLDADQDATADPVVDVQLQAGTRVFDASGAELDVGAIMADQIIESSGVLAISPTDPDTLWAEWVIVKEAAPAELETITGFVLSITGNDLTLFTDNGNRCVRILPDADVEVVTESSAGTTNSVGSLADVTLGREVDLFGTEAGDSCFEAESVVVFVIAD